MKKRNRGFVFLVLLLVSSCGKKHGQENTVTVAAAANMQFAIARIADLFSKKTGIPCELVIGSSGKLTAQIKKGAPYDLFVSANAKYPRDIYNVGLANAEPTTYAFGKLVLWTMSENLTPSISLLTDGSVRHIALANPKTAPYGLAAHEVLHHYELHDEVASKLVFGESIAQTNRFITTKSAEIGFTALSVVLAPKMGDKGKWIVLDRETYSPIAQTVVVLKRGQNVSEEALRFYAFLFSKETREILIDYGYNPNY